MIDLAAMRTAGWHGDLEQFRAVQIADFDKRNTRAYIEGVRDRKLGRTCGCPDCVERATAPQITVETTPRP